MKKIFENINILTELKIVYKKFKKYGFKGKIIKKRKINNLILFNSKKKIKDFAFVSHIDVVNEGNINDWIFFPFKFNVIGKNIISRGIVDMKGAILALFNAIKKLIEKKNIILIISGDEEGKAKYGSRIISKYIKKKKMIIKNCIVGEPTSINKICDTIKTGRRGSVNLNIKIKGKQEHVAYSKKKNSIENIFLLKKYLKKNKKLTISIVRVNSSNNNEYNVSPDFMFIALNIRFLKTCYYNKFLKNLIKVYRNKKISIEINIVSKIKPFSTKYNNSKNIKKIIKNRLGYYPKIKNEIGGTSDARFFLFFNNLFEMGLNCKYIHKVNEKSSIKDIKKLSNIYKDFIESIEIQ